MVLSRNPMRRSILIVPFVSVLHISAAAPAATETITLADMMRGIKMTQEQCAALPAAVWINAMGRSYCMRYYLSTFGGDELYPVVFLSGDRLGRLNTRTGAWFERSVGGIDTANLSRLADRLSRQAKVPAIYLARVGLDGSSGDHRVRHTVLELHATNAALNAIKQRHNFKGFHLIGHSGGAGLVAGLIALRDDVGCAVIGAGRLDQKFAPRPGGRELQSFNPADSIPAILRKSVATRIVVITDPADKKVPAHTQTSFVRKLRQAGKQIEQYVVQSTEQERHDVTPYARLAVADCIRGANAQELAQDIRDLVDQRMGAVRANPTVETVATPNPPVSAIPRQPIAAGDPKPKPTSRETSPAQAPAPKSTVAVPAVTTLQTDKPASAAARARE